MDRGAGELCVYDDLTSEEAARLIHALGQEIDTLHAARDAISARHREGVALTKRLYLWARKRLRDRGIQ